jgi:hypothetical protein
MTDDIDVASLAGSLAAGDTGPLDASLAGFGMRKPNIVWAPTAVDLGDERLRALLAYWSALPRERDGLPDLAAVDPVAMGPSVGYAMLLEALADGDFRYLLYGTRIAERAGFDMTGKRTSEVPTHPAIGRFFQAVYAAVALRRTPVFTRHVPPPQVAVTEWSRLILPIRGRDLRLGFLVGNVPGDYRDPDG